MGAGHYKTRPLFLTEMKYKALSIISVILLGIAILQMLDNRKDLDRLREEQRKIERATDSLRQRNAFLEQRVRDRIGEIVELRNQRAEDDSLHQIEINKLKANEKAIQDRIDSYDFSASFDRKVATFTELFYKD